MLFTLPFASIQPALGLVPVVSLDATSATVATAGDQADLCIVLDAGGAQVAGTQNDLTWDGTCASLASAADCHVNPATGETLFGGLSATTDFTYRGLVLSFSDIEPIPDGPLYCCTFTVATAPGTCCEVVVINAAASDPRGLQLVAVGNTAQLCVAADGAAFSATPTPTSTPTPTLHGDPGQPADGGGCQIAPASGGFRFDSIGVALLLALRRGRRNKREGLA